jgi:hypothetical protein
MSVLSTWLSHQGELGRLTNAAGEAVIPVIAQEAEIELEAGLNSFITSHGGTVASSLTPTVDELFTDLLKSAGLNTGGNPPAA